MDLLRSLLRAEFTAVNQQFIHVLALRRLGDQARAARIYEVDVIDFPNAMHILDRLAASGEPIGLPAELPEPGQPLTALLQAELRIEDRLQRILATPRAPDDYRVKRYYFLLFCLTIMKVWVILLLPSTT